MIIRCPHCDFSRTVDDDKVPPTARTATCPKCHHKFRFRDVEGVSGGGPETGPYVAGEGGYRVGAAAKVEVAPGAEYAPRKREDDGVNPAGVGGSEDIWDRVASLGENWLEDDGETDSFERDRGSERGGVIDDAESEATAVPWENFRHLGLLKAFWRTALKALVQPRHFFSSLDAPRALGLPLLFYLIVTAVQTYVFQAWVQIFPNGVALFGLSGIHALYDSAKPFYVMLATPVVWVAFWLCVCFLSVLALRFLSGKAASLVVALRVMAYASPPMLLCAIPFAGTVIGQLWAMFLFLFGCKRVFHLNLLSVSFFILPVYLFLAVLRIILSGSF